MTEDFVTFELAKKLKEKGFKNNCICYYDYAEEFHYNYESDIANKEIYFCHNGYDNIWHRDLVDAPTISQVLKWLREEKKMHIEPCILADADTDADGRVINEYAYWSFSVINIETGDMIYYEYEHIDDKRFDSYEEAANAGIEYCLDNLI